MYHVATVDDVKASIEAMDIKVVELEELKCRHARHKSFRLCLKKTDLPKMEQADLWPEGVMIRNFFRGKSRRPDGDATPIADGPIPVESSS